MMKKHKVGILVLVVFFMVSVLAGCGGKAGTDKAGDKEVKIDYPTKPVQLIVSYSAGAATDTQARILVKYAQKYLGQPIAVVNMAGAGGQVGWNYFAGVKPDGYTLAVYNLPHIIAQPLVGETQFSMDTFEPIMNWGWDPVVFAVQPDSKYQTLADLVEGAKSNPETITVGNAGLYVGQHLAQLMLEDLTGVRFKTMPYKGAADAKAALLGGHIDVCAGNLSDMYRLGNEVKILGIATKERSKFTPDVPTFQEQGYDVVMSTDRGISALKGTDPQIIEILEDAFTKAANDPEYLAEMDKAGADLLFIARKDVKAEMESREPAIKELLDKFGFLMKK
jgi:tripartite-type tricarboxylate transporter receptor subunit TctC